MLLLVLACQPESRESVWRDRMSPPLSVHEVAALPEHFVAVDLTDTTARFFGVGVGLSQSEHTLNPKNPALDEALLPAVFTQLDAHAPVVLSPHEGVHPRTVAATVRGALSAGMGPVTVLDVRP